MKAAVVKGKRLIAYEEVPTPLVQPGTLLLKTKYCSICGSDLEYVDDQAYGNPVKAGKILGHEFAAEVAAVGEHCAHAETECEERVPERHERGVAPVKF